MLVQQQRKLIILFRKVYSRDKNVAAVAQRIEAGLKVQPLTEMSLETASWLSTKGEGWGKLIYRQAKTAMKRDSLCIMPAWSDLTKYWDDKIVPPPVFTLDSTGVSSPFNL